MSLSEQDRDELWSGLRRARHEDAPVPLVHDAHEAHVLWAVAPAVEQIVARHVAAALTEAADAIEAEVVTNIGGHPYSDRDRGLRQARDVVRRLIAEDAR